MAKTGKRMFSQERHCGARTRSGAPCVRGKGERTGHRGQGRCWLHGGQSRVKHGMYSAITRPNLRKLMDEISQTTEDLMDLEPELLLLKALTIDYSNRYDAFCEALESWYPSHGEAVRVLLNTNDAGQIKKAIVQLRESINARPARVPDITAVSQLVDRIGKTVERMHKLQTAGAVSINELKRIMDAMGEVVSRHVDEETSQRIETEWKQIQVDGRP